MSLTIGKNRRIPPKKRGVEFRAGGLSCLRFIACVFFSTWVEGKIETAGFLLSINKLNIKVSSVLRPSF